MRNTVVAKAQQIAEDEARHGRSGNYRDLLNYVLRLINEAKAAGLPAVVPGAVRFALLRRAPSSGRDDAGTACCPGG